MSNVVKLFKDEVEEPSALSEIMEQYIVWAKARGADTDSAKFMYGCTSIMTLMEVGVRP